MKTKFRLIITELVTEISLSVPVLSILLSSKTLQSLLLDAVRWYHPNPISMPQVS